MITLFPADSAAVLPAVPVASISPLAPDYAPASSLLGFADLLASLAPLPEVAYPPAVPLAARPPGPQMPPPVPILLWQYTEPLKVSLPPETDPKASVADTDSSETDENETPAAASQKRSAQDNPDVVFFHAQVIVPPKLTSKTEASGAPRETVRGDNSLQPASAPALRSPALSSNSDIPASPKPITPTPADLSPDGAPTAVRTSSEVTPTPIRFAPEAVSKIPIPPGAASTPVLSSPDNSPKGAANSTAAAPAPIGLTPVVAHELIGISAQATPAVVRLYPAATSTPPSSPPETVPTPVRVTPAAVPAAVLPPVPALTSAAAPVIVTVRSTAESAVRLPVVAAVPVLLSDGSILPNSPASAAPFSNPAQIATSGYGRSSGDGESSSSENKNRFQSSDNKYDTGSPINGGTGRAYEHSAMSSITSTLAPTVAVARPAEVMTAASAVDAVRLIERVAEAAGNLSARPSEPVSLSIQLDDTHRVEVRVALHDGKVHASFRSDSPEVRAALSAAWHDFVRSPERAGQSWAEPVFDTLGLPNAVPVAESRADFRAEVRAESGLAGHGQEQQPRRHPADSCGEPLTGARPPAPGFAASATASSTPSVSRTDTSRHLSAVA